MYFWQLCQAQWKQNCIGSGTCVCYACKATICVTVSYLLPVSLLGAAFVAISPHKVNFLFLVCVLVNFL